MRSGKVWLVFVGSLCVSRASELVCGPRLVKCFAFHGLNKSYTGISQCTPPSLRFLTRARTIRTLSDGASFVTGEGLRLSGPRFCPVTYRLEIPGDRIRSYVYLCICLGPLGAVHIEITFFMYIVPSKPDQLGKTCKPDQQTSCF